MIYYIILIDRYCLKSSFQVQPTKSESPCPEKMFHLRNTHFLELCHQNNMDNHLWYMIHKIWYILKSIQNNILSEKSWRLSINWNFSLDPQWIWNFNYLDIFKNKVRILLLLSRKLAPYMPPHAVKFKIFLVIEMNQSTKLIEYTKTFVVYIERINGK